MSKSLAVVGRLIPLLLMALSAGCEYADFDIDIPIQMNTVVDELGGVQRDVSLCNIEEGSSSSEAIEAWREGFGLRIGEQWRPARVLDEAIELQEYFPRDQPVLPALVHDASGDPLDRVTVVREDFGIGARYTLTQTLGPLVDNTQRDDLVRSIVGDLREAFAQELTAEFGPQVNLVGVRKYFDGPVCDLFDDLAAVPLHSIGEDFTSLMSVLEAHGVALVAAESEASSGDDEDDDSATCEAPAETQETEVTPAEGEQLSVDAADEADSVDEDEAGSVTLPYEQLAASVYQWFLEGLAQAAASEGRPVTVDDLAFLPQPEDEEDEFALKFNRLIVAGWGSEERLEARLDSVLERGLTVVLATVYQSRLDVSARVQMPGLLLHTNGTLDEGAVIWAGLPSPGEHGQATVMASSIVMNPEGLRRIKCRDRLTTQEVLKLEKVLFAGASGPALRRALVDGVRTGDLPAAVRREQKSITSSILRSEFAESIDALLHALPID